MDNSVFNELNSLDVSKYIEKKNTGKVTLSYLSWSYAWQEVKKRYPDAKATIKMIDGKPYVFDPVTGYMVFTEVTINGETQEMWLPVMDSHNEAMLDKPRTVKTKYSSYTVDACTMFDINKTIMRCMAKNLAMFGLGLYIYNGEDLPESVEEEKRPNGQSNTTPSNDAMNLDAMLVNYAPYIEPKVTTMCTDALRSKNPAEISDKLNRLISYLNKKGVSIA